MRASRARAMRGIDVLFMSLTKHELILHFHLTGDASDLVYRVHHHQLHLMLSRHDFRTKHVTYARSVLRLFDTNIYSRSTCPLLSNSMPSLC